MECDVNAADAMFQALQMGGEELLSNPKQLRVLLSDFTGGDESPELMVLVNNCDEQLIGPFREAVKEGSALALSAAATRATNHLVGDLVIDRSVAARTADDIALGIAQWQGIGYIPNAGKERADAVGADETTWMDPFASSAVVPPIPTAQVTSAIDPAANRSYQQQARAVVAGSAVPGQLVPQAPRVEQPRRSGALVGAVVGACSALLVVGLVAFLLNVGRGGGAESSQPQTDAQVSSPAVPSDPEPELEPEPEPEPTPAPETSLEEEEPVTLMASDNDGVIMRSGAGNNHSEIAQLDPSVVMDYYGESASGPSSKGTSTWYKVIANGREGWVCGDYVEQLDGTVTVLMGKDGDPINMRELPQYGSAVVGQSQPGADIYWYGQVQQGVCSDGVVRDWYIINSGGSWGWARADNLVRK